MSNVYQVTGKLTDNRHVTLDEPIPVSAAGSVRVTVEVLQDQVRPDLNEFMEQLWERQRRRGHVPPTKEEVDAYLNAERDSWDS